MAHTEAKQGEGKVLSEKIKGMKVAMLTTIDQSQNILRSRPMVTQEMDFDGDLWFFLQADSALADEAKQHQVNLAYVSHEDDRYVSVSGIAQLIRDQRQIEKLWKPTYKIWFPNGKDDPNLALLKVTVTSAEFWDGPSSKMVQIFQAAQSLLTGQQKMGEQEKLNLK